jgi:hypothetical protein
MPATKHYPDLAAAEAQRLVIQQNVWTHDRDPQMLRMFAADRKDLRRVLSLYRKGKWQEAYAHARHMDTAARELIVERIWDDIQSAPWPTTFTFVPMRLP